MGLCSSSASEGGVSTQIDRDLQSMHKQERKVPKILLLGAGECGKSTILKQMMILHGRGFKKEEKIFFRSVIHRNILQSIQTLLKACQLANIPFQHPQTPAIVVQLLDTSSNDPSFPSNEFSFALQYMWRNEQQALRTAMQYGPQIHLLDSAEYFLSDSARFLDSSFTPSDFDILKCRSVTTGVNELILEVEGDTLRFIDVGGQRGERKKWVHAFDDVTCILYIGSLSEYDQTLAEDNATNRLAESLALFEEIVQQQAFLNIPLVLFLNKYDIFKKKVQTVDLGQFCPSYTGGCDHDTALQFITQCYQQIHDSAGRINDFRGIKNLDMSNQNIFLTDATDTEMVRKVWQTLFPIVRRSALKWNSLMAE